MDRTTGEANIDAKYNMRENATERVDKSKSKHRDTVSEAKTLGVDYARVYAILSYTRSAAAALLRGTHVTNLLCIWRAIPADLVLCNENV
ncbi:hypothetical protein BCON_0013g00060 [Botryotinia convoluta]|uniref:Uncharacterized protein n=1 Tax=Botryotinia convoluta TaxID=54673 RepID=A0A4Z1IUX8_9HELO|nr:hypothetical protein BCON_0013g00060 [Botryotinia convoluta]